MSVDPLQKKYPGESPYLYTGGNPIFYVDPDGKDKIEHIRTIGIDGTALIKEQTTKGVYKSVWNNTYYGIGYATKNDYEVFTTHDLRTGKDVVTTSTNILYGTPHATEIDFGTYLKIKVTGSDGETSKGMPYQFVIFGSATEDPGWYTRKADPNSRVIALDFKAFESMMGLAMTGMKVPDLKGADPKKIPDILEKFRKEQIYHRDSKDESGKFVPGAVINCKTCKRNFEVTSPSGDGRLTTKPATDTMDLEKKQN